MKVIISKVVQRQIMFSVTTKNLRNVECSSLRRRLIHAIRHNDDSREDIVYPRK